MTVPRDMCDTSADNPCMNLSGCQNTARKRKSRESPVNKDGSNQHKRRKVLNEIYETEKTYQHHLMLLTTLFLEPVKVSSILPPRIVDGLFSNIEAIQSVSLHLLELMEEHGVVHSLLELAPYMKLYSIYANNFNTSAKLLEELQNRSADFTRLLKFQESREEMESLKLSSLLITPIQRVPRYRLLLENLLQKTQDDDPNFPKLKDAYEEIAKVTSHINECVRQHENFNKMLAIQNSFVGVNAPQILLPGRLFLREGAVSKISKRGNAKERILFLFNDMLICAKKETSNMYQCCDVYQLINCIVEQVMGSADIGNGLFKVICPEKFLLLCSKQEDKAWVADIKTAISELHENLASLKRGDMLHVHSYETLKMKTKSKVTSPRKMFKSRSSNESICNSPLLADIANLTATKRNTIVLEPTISIFDLYRNSGDLDLTGTSFTFDLDSFINNNSLMMNNTTETDENVELCKVDEEVEESHNASVEYFKPTADWSVTEKDGTTENREALASLHDQKICCAGKGKDNGNVTGPYIKMKKTKWNKDQSLSSVYTSDIDKRVVPSLKQSVWNESSANCLLM